MKTLDLGLIGNGALGALVSTQGEICWACLPRPDGDPVFCSLLRERDNASPELDFGYFAVDLQDCARAEQHYLPNTAVLITRLFTAAGDGVEIVDFAPRFIHHGREFRPVMLIRTVSPIAGAPRISVRCRPAAEYGAVRPTPMCGSSHLRYSGPNWTLRLTTDASITAVLQETAFYMTDPVTLVLGADETLQDAPGELARRFLDETTRYWRTWVRSLAIPFEWQAQVIRAAITLQLNAFDDTGAILAALTTSLPESALSHRNWDYRYCWLRDAYFVVHALNRLGATRVMERYLGFLLNVVANERGEPLLPVYGVDGRAELPERTVDSLPGFRGIGPVRVGNQAYEQVQHDVYGAAILAVAHLFFDQRLTLQGDAKLFERLELLGNHAVRAFGKPDAGPWELRGEARVHTFSAVMCWAACDRLARIAAHLGLDQRQGYWAAHALVCRQGIEAKAWNPQVNSFTATFGGNTLDASALLLVDLGFLEAGDPRFAATVSAIEADLKRGDFVYRYVEADDFGEPENAFVICTFWYINALVSLERRQEARALFEKLLSHTNRHGLLAEHIDPRTGVQWGNFVQTYSMVGLINAAVRLSVRWDQAI
jgi:hypothetical protein